MAMAASQTRYRSSLLPNNALVPRIGAHLHLKTASLRVLPLVFASSKRQSADDKPPVVSQEDVKYLVQLGGASVAGAAAIKYGSIIFPEMTQPNLAQALFMIFAPLAVVVFLLFKQSRV
ncbi:uncharacterized protein LOC131006836 [Salvia miltiorrhiza]|uniref:uncharacterized protein LOC131006836 n=1 Tax=Salvia miltiorrhiza TaxID=226208 RepID=UPI0025ACF466|nr:uncharacterized protein LOC131006836 [Salvia miltiorrhiza]